MATLKDIFGWFASGKTPTEAQFSETWKSFWHKSEKLPIEQIQGLQDALKKATTDNKGIFSTSVALMSSYPVTDNKKGWYAFVGTANPFRKWTVSADGGAWADSAEDINVADVDLSEYAKSGGSERTMADIEESAGFSNMSFISDRKWLFALTSGKEIYAGLKKDGNWYFNSDLFENVSDLLIRMLSVETNTSENVSGITSLNALVDNLNTLVASNTNSIASLNSKISFVSDRRWLFAISFSNEIYVGLKKDGELYFNSKKIDTLQEVVNSIGDVSVLQNINIVSDRKWLFALSSGNEIYAGLKKDGQFYFNSDVVSKVAELDLRVSNLEFAKLVVAWGDSLTAGAGGARRRNKEFVIAKLLQMGHDLTAYSESVSVTYPKIIQTLLGSSYNVVNEGVGGETINTIGARQGAWNSIAPIEFTIPADANTTVEIANTTTGILKSSYDGKNTQVFSQGDSSQINPCYVEGIACTLSVAKLPDGTVTNYYLRRNISSDRNVTIPLRTPIIFSGAKKYRNTDIAILWCFQNGGYDNNDDLVEKLKLIVSNIGTKKFIIVGIHSGTSASRSEQNIAIQRAFGDKFFDWGRYVSTNALSDFGIVPTTDSDLTVDQLANGVKSDAYQMSVGGLPSSLWSVVFGLADYDGAAIDTTNDSVHMNGAGYMILGYKLYERINQLGYI